MDVHSPEKRSFNMSRIKGKDTKPELIIRRWLWHKGYRYRLHRKDIPGKPDIVFSGRKKVIFVNGCFWHMHECQFFKWPKTNVDFWRKKILENVERDQNNYKKLRNIGWEILVIWECEIKSVNKVFEKIEEFLL
jgi:DNA mismatch endonuclease (patch repair protein)